MAKQIPWPTTERGWFVALLLGNLLAVVAVLLVLARPGLVSALVALPVLLLWGRGLLAARAWFGRRR